MSKHRVLVAGMGKRGKHHATHFHANPRFEVVGLCDIVPEPLAQFAVGVLYAEGRGVAKDEREALRWYRAAAEQGVQLRIGHRDARPGELHRQ